MTISMVETNVHTPTSRYTIYMNMYGYQKYMYIKACICVDIHILKRSTYIYVYVYIDIYKSTHTYKHTHTHVCGQTGQTYIDAHVVDV